MSARSSVYRVASVQMVFAPTIEENLRKIDSAAELAAQRGARTALFPECATTGYRFDFSSLKPAPLRAALHQVAAIARRRRINVLVGSPVFRGRKLFNCLVVASRTGRLVYCYAKNQLTPMDCMFASGNNVALFELDGIPMTTIICHERRYPELVRLAVMAGAKILWHPNAGLDDPAVSKAKRGGRDGVAARAFENAVHYVFANTVGPQGGDKWSAGDSKIVAPDENVLALADNQREAVITADLDLSQATRIYAERSLQRPPFLAPHWRRMVAAVRRQAKRESDGFLKALG